MSGWGVQALEAASVAARATLLKPLSRGFAMQGLPLCLLRLLPLPFIRARRIALLPSSRALQACQPSPRHGWVAFLDVLLELMDCCLPHGSPSSCLSDALMLLAISVSLLEYGTQEQLGRREQTENLSGLCTSWHSWRLEAQGCTVLRRMRVDCCVLTFRVARSLLISANLSNLWDSFAVIASRSRILISMAISSPCTCWMTRSCLPSSSSLRASDHVENSISFWS